MWSCLGNMSGLRRAGRTGVPRAGARAGAVVALVLGVAAVQAPRALASGGGGPQAALAPATVVTVTPWLRLSYRSGPPTVTIRVSGGGFEASESVDVYFDNTDEARAATNAHGYFAPVKLHVPAAAVPGMHWVSAKGRTSGRSAQRRFTVATPWDQFGRVPRHTHANPYENVLSPSNVSGLTRAWHYRTGAGVSSPAVAHGVVYAGSADDSVYALNARTGAKLWSYATGGTVFSSPAVAKGVVYVGSYDNSVYALNAKTGAKLWSYPTGFQIYSSPAVANGTVYVGSFDGNLYALNAATGARLWSFAAPGGFFSSPAVANGVVYAGAENGTTYALDAATGARLWSSGTGGNSFPVVANGKVYVGSNNANVYAFDLPAGPHAPARPHQAALHPNYSLHTQR
jgi:hypothetical protein